MKILRDHFLKEFLSSFAMSLLTFLFIFLLGRGFIQMADLVFNKNVDPLLILKILFYSLPFMLTFIIPMSVLVATLMTFGKLSYDNELMAMRANGISLARATIPVMTAVVLLSLFSYLLADRLAAESHYVYRRLLMQIGIESPAAALEEATFIKKFKNFVIFIYEIDGNKLRGIRIYQPQEGRPTRTIIAESGELISIPEKNIIKLKLNRGTSDEPDPKDPTRLYKLNFMTYDLPLNLSSSGQVQELGKKPKDMTVKELKKEIIRLGDSGIHEAYPLTAEIHNKAALAIASIAFALVGIPLGIATKRREKTVGFGISLALMTLYWTLLIAGKSLAQKGLAPPFLSLQFSNLIVGGIGAYFFSRMVRN